MKDYFNFKGMINEDFDKESSAKQSAKERLLNYLYKAEEGCNWQELFEEFLNYVPDSVINAFAHDVLDADIDDHMFDAEITEDVDDLCDIDVTYKIIDSDNECVCDCKDVDDAIYKARLHDALRVDMYSCDPYSHDESVCTIWDREDGLI